MRGLSMIMTLMVMTCSGILLDIRPALSHGSGGWRGSAYGRSDHGWCGNAYARSGQACRGFACGSRYGGFYHNGFFAMGDHAAPLTFDGNDVATQIHLQSEPQVSLSELISSLDDQLIRLHESNRIGSFDIDAFSSRLLSIKRNYSVMKQRTGRISINQQNILTKDLLDLRNEISAKAAQGSFALSEN